MCHIGALQFKRVLSFCIDYEGESLGAIPSQVKFQPLRKE